jgi:hypothetical protein
MLPGAAKRRFPLTSGDDDGIMPVAYWQLVFCWAI